MAKTLSRTELYDLVWSKPMTKAALDFEISDVGLRKICVKHDIPTPPLGYWAKKAAGYKVKQPALPADTKGKTKEITIYGNTNAPSKEIIQAMETARQRVPVKKPTHKPLVDPAREIHSAILATAKSLRESKQSDDSAYAYSSGHCGINVGHPSIERTISILDAIAYALDAQGLALRPTGTAMKVANATDELTFKLTERIRSQPHIPTKEELAKQEKLKIKHGANSWMLDYDRAYPKLDYIRTGELGVEIENGYVTGARRSWRDGKTQKVEDFIDDIAVGIVAYLAGLKARREERDRQHQEWQERAKRRELVEEYQQREIRRQDFVLEIAKDVTEIETLQKLLQRIPNKSAGNPGEFTRMIEWVQNRISALEEDISREAISDALQRNNLFPETDELIAVLDKEDEDEDEQFY